MGNTQTTSENIVVSVWVHLWNGAQSSLKYSLLTIQNNFSVQPHNPDNFRVKIRKQKKVFVRESDGRGFAGWVGLIGCFILCPCDKVRVTADVLWLLCKVRRTVKARKKIDGRIMTGIFMLSVNIVNEKVSSKSASTGHSKQQTKKQML